MKKLAFLSMIVLSTCAFTGLAQSQGTERKVKSVASYNLERKTKELDHVTLFNQDGLKSEEIEYFADGMVKTKTQYEYDNKKNCIKITRYNPKGKIEKITFNEFDSSGNKVKESTLNNDKRLKTDKVFEYTFY